jgi:hypothetical protein
MSKITIQEINENTLRVLTLNEPFASLMAFYDKQETRLRPTKVRGLVAIHAAMKPYPATTIYNIAGWEQYQRICAISTKPEYLGKIIAIGRLVDCKPMADYAAGVEIVEKDTYVRFHYGLFVWVFEDMTPVNPIPWRGKQGWGIYPQDLKSLIEVIK